MGDVVNFKNAGRRIGKEKTLYGYTDHIFLRTYIRDNKIGIFGFSNHKVKFALVKLFEYVYHLDSEQACRSIDLKKGTVGRQRAIGTLHNEKINSNLEKESDKAESALFNLLKINQYHKDSLKSNLPNNKNYMEKGMLGVFGKGDVAISRLTQGVMFKGGLKKGFTSDCSFKDNKTKNIKHKDVYEKLRIRKKRNSLQLSIMEKGNSDEESCESDIDLTQIMNKRKSLILKEKVQDCFFAVKKLKKKNKKELLVGLEKKNGTVIKKEKQNHEKPRNKSRLYKIDVKEQQKELMQQQKDKKKTVIENQDFYKLYHKENAKIGHNKTKLKSFDKWMSKRYQIGLSDAETRENMQYKKSYKFNKNTTLDQSSIPYNNTEFSKDKNYPKNVSYNFRITKRNVSSGICHNRERSNVREMNHTFTEMKNRGIQNEPDTLKKNTARDETNSRDKKSNSRIKRICHDQQNGYLEDILRPSSIEGIVQYKINITSDQHNRNINTATEKKFNEKKSKKLLEFEKTMEIMKKYENPKQ